MHKQVLAQIHAMPCTDKVEIAAGLFGSNASVAAEVFAALITEHGYAAVQPVLERLDTPELDETSRYLLTALRRPEWTWFDSETREGRSSPVKFFGLTVSGVQKIRGYYITGKYETGSFEVLQFDDYHGAHRPTAECLDPMELSETRPVKAKVYRTAGEYYIAKVGRIVDLLRAGFESAKIRYNTDGYFDAPAYVLDSGPFPNVDAARAAKA